MGRGQINAKGMPMAMLTQKFGQMLGRTVVDKTDCQRAYDIELNFTPEAGAGPDGVAASDNSGPTIYTALQEQLGLKLESQSTATKMLMIEKVDKSSENEGDVEAMAVSGAGGSVGRGGVTRNRPIRRLTRPGSLRVGDTGHNAKDGPDRPGRGLPNR